MVLCDWQVIKVSIEIIDINDNAPAFSSAHVIFDIVEATQLGSVYVIQAATDVDSPAYGVQKYELDSESGKFGLQISTKLDGSQEVRSNYSTQLKVYLPITENIEKHNSTTPNGRLPERPKPI